MLIVEDDRDTRELLAQALVDEGYGVGTAEDGMGAMRYLQSHAAPQVILLDWRMPKSDGVEFRRLQRADGGASDLGVAELLIKPIDVDRLLEVVSRYAGPPPGRQ